MTDSRYLMKWPPGRLPLDCEHGKGPESDVNKKFMAVETCHARAEQHIIASNWAILGHFEAGVHVIEESGCALVSRSMEERSRNSSCRGAVET